MSDLGDKVKQGPSLKARALRLLSLREYSRKGLASKLEESEARRLQRASLNNKEPEVSGKPIALQIEEVLDDFEARGWL